MGVEKSISVLIVEDDASMAALIRRHLSPVKNQKFEVESAARLSQALDAIERRTFDVILLDLLLPDSEKLDTLAAILSKAPEMPVVVLSSLDDEMLALKAVRYGAQDYLVKQKLDAKLLTRVILYAIERNRMLVLLNWHTRELQSSKDRFRSVIETVTDSIIVVNKDGAVYFVNPAAEKLFNIKSEQLLGRRLHFPVVPGETTELELSNGTAESLVAEMRVSKIEWEGESAYLASLRNITLHKQIEQKLTKANQDLKQVNRMKSDFISTASHELRTPLTSIKNSISILANGKAGVLNEKQEGLLKIAGRNTDRLTQMIEELLDLSRIESGKLKLQFTDVDLSEMMQHVVATFQSQASDKSIRLNMHKPQNMPKLYTDCGRLEQILCNLVSNAIKYTPDEGLVTLSAQSSRERVEISVTDTGPGLSPDEQKRIFDRFYQVGEEIAATSKGLGLGLYIVKKLVTELRGEISLESQPGKGSRFFFTLPVYSDYHADKVLLENEILNCPTNTSYSLLVIDLRQSRLSETGDIAADKQQMYLDQLIVITKKAFPRASDRVLHQKAFNRLTIMLGGTPKPGARIAKEKLENAFRENAALNPPPNVLGPFTYPDDGDNTSAIIDFMLRLTN